MPQQPSIGHVPDPRPTATLAANGRLGVRGWRCCDCGHPVALSSPWCPVCRGSLTETAFPGRGSVWSCTILRVALPGRTPPFGLAYVDLEDGPRVLGHFPPGSDLRVHDVVVLDRVSEAGDLMFERLDGGIP
jgi:uncharacterized protein